MASSSSHYLFKDLNFDFPKRADSTESKSSLEKKPLIFKDIFESNSFLEFENSLSTKELHDLSLKYFENGLLHEETVWKWLFHELHFESKIKEDEWGKYILSKNYTNYGKSVMWTGTFGKKIIFEFFQGMHKNIPDLFPENPIEEFRLDQMQPDIYVPGNYVVEVKTSTYMTRGTANEKIFSVPIKYSSVTNVFHVPKLYILVLGNAEVYFKKMIDTELKKQMLQFYYEKLNHRFVPATKLLQCISLLQSLPAQSSTSQSSSWSLPLCVVM